MFERVNQGINFSKVDESSSKKILEFNKTNMPDNEINDSDQSNDYSYFFYKGMTETIVGAQN